MLSSSDNVYDGLMSASSLGEYHDKLIKNQFKLRKNTK
ncbi:KTSC domain-containing protein [Bacillus licheniformis]|nr:KTSC domain-containing protein [Bacillus licheniformis]